MFGFADFHLARESAIAMARDRLESYPAERKSTALKIIDNTLIWSLPCQAVVFHVSPDRSGDATRAVQRR